MPDVTHHAVIRYLERVLRLPVEEWLEGKQHLQEWQRCAICCERAGLPVEAVRASILHPAIARVCAAGFDDVAVRLDGFVYIVKQGVVITVLTSRLYISTMTSRHASVPQRDPSRKRRKERRRLALAEA